MLKRETFSAKAYKDGEIKGVQMYSIGYGHQIRANETSLKTTTITEAHARQIFQNDVKPLEDQINKSVKYSVNQSQFDALVDFGYNVGSGSLTLIINTWNTTGGSAKKTADRMLLYNKTTVDGKKVLSKELVSRRAENAAMFLGVASTSIPVVALIVGSVLALFTLSR